MGKFIIFFVLVVTTGRWAGVFSPVDRFVVLNVPITAIGTGIIMGLGVYYTIETLQTTNERYRDRLAKWKMHDESMNMQGKTNRKPKPEPSGNRIWLGLFFGTLLTLTTLSQTPYIVSELASLSIQDTLTVGIAREYISLWLYGTILVLSPEIIVAAVALAAHERGAIKDGKGKSDTSLRDFRDGLLSKIVGKVPEDIQEAAVEEREDTQRASSMLVCFCGWSGTASKRGMNSHIRKHVKEAKLQGTSTKAYKWFVEKYPDAYDGGEYDVEPPTREVIARWLTKQSSD